MLKCPTPITGSWSVVSRPSRLPISTLNVAQIKIARHDQSKNEIRNHVGFGKKERNIMGPTTGDWIGFA